MAEYIDRDQIKWHCEYQDDHCDLEDCKNNCPNLECSYQEVMQIPPADVVEREKVNKAMKQIEELSGQSCMVSDGIIDEVLEILEECIGE